MSPDGNAASGGRGGGRRVVLTGVGLVSPLGNEAAALWRALAAGESGLAAAEELSAGGFRTRVCGRVREFNPRKLIADAKTLKLMTRSVRLGVAASELAIADARLDLAGVDPFRLACYVGSPGHAGDRDELLPALQAASRETDGPLDMAAFGAEGIATINPLWLLKSLANIVLYFVSMKLGAQGPNGNICMSGAGGVMAIGEAFRCLRRGAADIAVAGGYESLLEEERLESFEPSGLLYLRNGHPAQASRPFDRDRAGFVPAEGGAFVVLEELEAALHRGARIYGEVTGYGLASPGCVARPSETAEAFLGAMQAALADARRDPWELEAVSAYGLATVQSDRAEAEALKSLLTARAAYVPITAVKSATGNLSAGSGPLEVIAACGVVQGAMPGLPPILNCEHPDPGLGLDYVRGGTRAGSFRRILVNSASLSGAAASLLVESGDSA
ncbi:MAG: beta-ketoacyl-[acyl-carrier-protein] synthase family protein [Terriglobales bacterium]